jgi:uncharacterized protein (DUF697 family)
MNLWRSLQRTAPRLGSSAAPSSVTYPHVQSPNAPLRCRDQARNWVHAFAASGAAYAFVPIPVPGSTTTGLITLETAMVHAIARVYGDELHFKDAAAYVAGLEVAGGALKTIAREACVLIPGVGWLVRAGIAAAAIEAIGNAVIVMFERKHPNRYCV